MIVLARRYHRYCYPFLFFFLITLFRWKKNYVDPKMKNFVVAISPIRSYHKLPLRRPLATPSPNSVYDYSHLRGTGFLFFFGLLVGNRSVVGYVCSIILRRRCPAIKKGIIFQKNNNNFINSIGKIRIECGQTISIFGASLLHPR